MPSMSMSIREAGAHDIEFLSTTTADLFLQYGSYDAYLLEWLRDEHVTTRIAEADGDRAGFHVLAVYPDGGALVGELLAIAVVPSFQNRRVGSALLDDALGAVSSAGGREVRLSVADGNARAERLFASRGFRRTEEYGVYPSGRRAILMVRKANSV